jgi:mycobactin peptide synthetase MbtE
VLLPGERTRVLEQWGSGGPLDTGLFSARVNAAPADLDRIAVRRGDRALDYRALDNRALDADSNRSLADVVDLFLRARAGDVRYLPPPSTDAVRLIAVRSDAVTAAELLAGLSDNATVIIASDSQRDDSAALAALITEHSVERVVAEPDVLALLPHSGVSMMPSVRTWVAASAGGPRSLAEILLSLSANSVAEYRYAPVYFGGIAVTGTLDGSRPGRPVPGSQVALLDSAGNPVPHGVVGNVHLGTSPSLLVDTGDRAHWDNTGSIVFDIDAPDAAVTGVAGSGLPPQTATERALCETLAELLDIDDVGRDDNFFALGGDSVISIQLAGRLAAEGIPLTPQMIFDHHTIGEMAAAVDEALVNPEADAAVVPESAASTHAPMSVSGLSDDALAALTASWKPGP